MFERFKYFDKSCSSTDCCGGKCRFTCYVVKFLVCFGVSFATLKLFVVFEIEKYVRKHPKTIVQSVEDMYKNEMKTKKEESEKKLPDVASSIVANEKLPYIGSKNGKNVVIEFFDFLFKIV